ncbi:MAG: arsenical-resistance protein [Methyloversatilis sp.]|nr:arsenical-resistance protein [Methyloversatilis sp.]
MGMFERWLTLWVGLAIIAGVALGLVAPSAFAAVAALELAHVNLVVAVLIWVMIYPMMIQIDFAAVRDVGRRPQGLILTLVVNWLIKPFTMAALGVLFFQHLFAPWVDPQSASEYIAGMILLGVTDVAVPWETLLLSTALYVVLPLLAGVLTRRALGNGAALAGFVARLKPWSIVGLLATVVLLFGFQAETIVAQPFVIALIAVPLVLQTYGIFAIAFVAARMMKLPYPVAAPACLIGTSNFFELAVAVAISLFGLHSGAALATVVGVLVEVPVMLSLVAFTRRSAHLFPDSAELF